MSTEQTRRPRVLLFPWLAYGHILPFLELAKKLAQRGVYVYLCSTPANLKSIQEKLTPIDAAFLAIRLVDLHLLALPELPPARHTTNGLPRRLIPALMKAMKMAKPSLTDTIDSLRPDLVIHDPVLPWVAAVAHAFGIPSVRFLTGGAVALSYFWHAFKHPASEFPFPRVQLRDFEKADLQRMIRLMVDQRDSRDEIRHGSSTIMLVKTSRAIEGKYIDYLSRVGNIKNIVPVGPLVEDPVLDRHDKDTIDLIQWLGEQNDSSTLFVSFGSEYYLGKEEIEEMAFGLELSQVNFIWAVRFPEGDHMTADKALPEGFLERIGDRGRVVGWAPQSRILSHSSIGGFVSHCGWSSTLESLVHGVPLITAAMHLDQPANAKLMAEIGVAIEIPRDEEGKLRRDEISKVIKDVMFGNAGGKLRQQARNLRQRVKTREKEEMDFAYQQLLALINSRKANL